MRRVVACPLHVYVHCQKSRQVRRRLEGIGGQTEARAELVTGYAEHRASLQEKKNYRRAIKIDLKLPEASTALAGVPRRKDFAEGGEGRLAWKAQFNAYAGDFAYSHVGTETVRNRMGAVGMWGDYCKREGHGTFVEWQRQEKGTLNKILVPVRDTSSGKMKVPDPECIAEYVMVMAIGDTKARPKGGTAEYRAAWHHGSQHAHFKLRAREHGRGAYADTPLRFVSIEKMKEALEKSSCRTHYHKGDFVGSGNTLVTARDGMGAEKGCP